MSMPFSVSSRGPCVGCNQAVSASGPLEKHEAPTTPGPTGDRNQVGIIREIHIGSTRAVEEVPEWEVLEMAVDSGASATVIGEEMVKAVAAQNIRPDVKYEVADGSHIPHMGEKKVNAFTECGLSRNLVAQVTEVNKALLSVSKIVGAGNRVVFDDEGSYIEHKTSGEWMPLEERGGIYVLKMWVPREQKSPF